MVKIPNRLRTHPLFGSYPTLSSQSANNGGILSLPISQQVQQEVDSLHAACHATLSADGPYNHDEGLRSAATTFKNQVEQAAADAAHDANPDAVALRFFAVRQMREENALRQHLDLPILTLRHQGREVPYYLPEEFRDATEIDKLSDEQLKQLITHLRQVLEPTGGAVDVLALTVEHDGLVAAVQLLLGLVMEVGPKAHL